jgi:hypothetical protein
VIQNFGSKAPQVVPGQAPLPIPFIFEPSALIQANTNMPVNAAVFTPFQNYIIYAAHSDGLKAIDVSQASSSFGNLILYSFHGAPNQRFIFEQEGNLYRIKSISSGALLLRMMLSMRGRKLTISVLCLVKHWRLLGVSWQMRVKFSRVLSMARMGRLG